MAHTHGSVKRTTAPLRNTGLMMDLVERLVNRPPNVPGIGIFHGFSGMGKTVSATLAANVHRAFFLQITPDFTRKYFYQKMLHAVGKPNAKGSIPELADQLTATLGDLDDPVLFLDDAHYIFVRHYRAKEQTFSHFQDVIRTLHDVGGASIVLIGEEDLPQIVERHESIHNRVAVWQEAMFADMSDARHMADMLCPDTMIGDDLLQEILTRSGRLLPRIISNLYLAADAASEVGAMVMDLEAWGERSYFTGKTRRRTAA
ncbi:MAG: ATP-binding protein [Magnetococcales bacterium]|nr:ATP-binding protein [Magnetococcales bacterium]